MLITRLTIADLKLTLTTLVRSVLGIPTAPLFSRKYT